MSKADQLPANNDGKYEIIQVLRFVAALMVIILHSTFYTSERLDSHTIIYNQGYDGVKLFFVISGFVMVVSSEKLLNKPKGWISFGVKRIIRIVPIYWIITSYKILVMIFASRLVLHTVLNGEFILKSFFFIPTLNKEGMFRPFYGVGWTLNYEMFFYLLFTISLAIRVRPLIFLSLILIPLSVLSIFKTPSWPEIITFYADPIILYFLYGVIIAKLILNNIKLQQSLSLVLIIIGLIILFFPTGVFTITNYLSYNYIANNIATIFIIYGGASLETLWGKKMPNILVFLGAASYSLYLVHPSVSPLAPTVLKLLHLKIVWLSVLLGVVSSIIIAIAFYWFCERPITKFLNKITRKKDLDKPLSITLKQ